jgi:hypothetical protein
MIGYVIVNNELQSASSWKAVVVASFKTLIPTFELRTLQSQVGSVTTWADLIGQPEYISAENIGAKAKGKETTRKTKT